MASCPPSITPVIVTLLSGWGDYYQSPLGGWEAETMDQMVNSSAPRMICTALTLEILNE